MRSEAAKHRHSLTQVLTWAAVVLIYSIAVFFVLDRLGVPVTGLVAPATVLGVGLGFGAQRIVGDVLAGLLHHHRAAVRLRRRRLDPGGRRPDAATGTVEDVTLRVTRLRSPNGEVITVPNGQIVKVVNLSRDWARAVVDVPVPTSVDVNRVNEILRDVGREAFPDPALRPLLLDPPSVMGVESLGLDAGQRADGRPHAARQAVRGRPRPARPRRPGLPPARGMNVPPPPPSSAASADGDPGREER